MRQLATIRTIEKISSIPEADKIDVCLLKDLQYECVIKKGEYQVGQKIVYLECDSICPETADFEFLREGKFRIKIRKYRKQISEGLVMPITILPTDCKIEEGKEVTYILGIKNYVRAEEESEESQLANENKNRSPFMRFLMNVLLFRKIYLALNSKIKGNFPTQLGISKTDENRVQTCARKLMDHYDEEWYITEKCDGSSTTFFTYLLKKWGKKIKEFGVCSRSIWIKTKNNSNFWNIAIKYDLEKKFKQYSENVTCQGECCGPKIQDNKYKLDEIDLFVFNVFLDGKMLSVDAMESFCNNVGIKTVPIINRSFIPSRDIGVGKEVKEVVDFMVKLSQGDSKLYKRMREGIVVRLVSNPTISFKVINPYFLLEQEEKLKKKKPLVSGVESTTAEISKKTEKTVDAMAGV